MNSKNKPVHLANHAAALESCRILVVSANIEDHKSLQRIFSESRASMLTARTVRESLTIIRHDRSSIPVVICEHSLPDGDWKQILAELQRTRPETRLIVCSRLADDRLWVEVLNLGGYDLLQSAPYVPEEVRRVTHNAWSGWQNAMGNGSTYSPIAAQFEVAAVQRLAS